MSVKLIVLKSGENLISEIKEGFFEEKLACYLLDKPCSIQHNDSVNIINESGRKCVNVSLHSWPSFTDQEEVQIIPDWVVAIVDPNKELKRMYEKQVLGK